MIYNIKAIPQIYNGVQFRSRLEASWAAFFDQLSWKWEYEPFDLDGWLPDFKISAPIDRSSSLLVEIKPYDFSSDEKDVRDISEKIFHAHQDETLLLGLAPFGEGIGYLLSPPSENNWCTGSPDIAVLNKNESHYDISAFYGSYAFRFSGEYNGDHHLRYVDNNTIERLWKNARNDTQWKKQL